MRIEDVLYFAPGLRFSDVDLEGEQLPAQIRRRFIGFYIEPARVCAAREHAFASGVILVSCLDALARLARCRKRTSKALYIDFIEKSLPAIAEAGLAERFYDEIRCGLVHEARLKNGAQFSLTHPDAVHVAEDMLMVNPHLLGEEITSVLERLLADLERSPEHHRQVSGFLKSDFVKELEMSGRTPSPARDS